MPWVQAGRERSESVFKRISGTLEILLMGYGVYCLASRLKDFIFSRKRLPKHEESFVDVEE